MEGGKLRLRSDELSGTNKGSGVLSRLNNQPIAFAYGDTWADIPILEKAETAVAVYPDKWLRSKAIEADWEILENE